MQNTGYNHSYISIRPNKLLLKIYTMNNKLLTIAQP